MVRIVGGVIDALWSAETPVDNRDSQMIVKPCEVGTAAGVAHLRLERIRREIGALSPDIINAALMAWIGNALRDVAQQFPQ